METLRPILAEHPFFKDLEERHLDLVAGCASNVRFKAGDFIFRHGEEANEFYLIREGLVAIEMFVTGRGAVNVQTIGEGQILGWSWLVPPYRWMFDAHALETTRAIALDGICLRNKSEQDHDLGYQLLKRFATIVQKDLDAARLQILNIYEVHA
ncbi:MAG: cyclic nucleotide-binding domain-containing protein [Acidobacteria bacterium]|nr:MAG: cyclic nucleotide-binding domain-containing protein [Acidobacteriota bacterium]